MGCVDVTRPSAQVAVITLNRPESRNAMNAELIAGLWNAFDEIDQDRDCRVIILTGRERASAEGLT